MKLNRIRKSVSSMLAASFMLIGGASSLSVSAGPEPVLSKSSISKNFQSVVPFKVYEINDHETGLYEIVADKGIFYASKDGKYLFSGSIHQFQSGLPNLTDAKKSEIGSEIIHGLTPSFVTYKAPQEEYEILVFFDTSCGYCRKMHADMSRYNAMGITVHYALYPRSGLTDRNGDPMRSAMQLANVACSNNPQMAMNTVMQGGQIANVNCNAPIKQHYNLGQWLGVRGTPAVFDLDGKQLIPGYAPPAQLLQTLQATQGRS